MTDLRVAVVGYGYWGPNLARCVHEAEGCQLAVVADADERRLEAARRRYPWARTVASAEAAVRNRKVDAVVVATPLGTHAEIAGAALRAGKHVLVAKPLAASVVEAEALASLAESSGLALVVDHTFLYSPAVRELRRLVEAGELGDVLYADSARANLGLFRHDADVVWDLAAHDVAILRRVLGRDPDWVSAAGSDPVGHGHASVAYLQLGFGEVLAGVHVNWLSPVKVRRTVLGGSRRTAVYDNVEPSEKVRVYDAGVTVDRASALVDYRVGDVLAPHLPMEEPLAVEVADFVACCAAGASGGPEGVAVVRALEAASASMASGGARVRVS